jgi:hypothetical protein
MTTNFQQTNGASTNTIPGSQDMDALMAAKAVELVQSGYTGTNAIGIPIVVSAFSVVQPVDAWLVQASALGIPVGFLVDAITSVAKDVILKDKLLEAQLQLASLTMSGKPRTSAINDAVKKLEAIVSSQTKINETIHGSAETKLRREDVLFLHDDSLDYVGSAYSWYSHDWVDAECMNDACECGMTETVNQRGAWLAMLETAHYNEWSLAKLGGAMREYLNVQDNQFINLGHPETGGDLATCTYTLEATASMPFGGLMKGFNLYQFDNRGDKGENPNSRCGWTGQTAYTTKDGVDITERLAVQQWLGADVEPFYDAEDRNNAQAVVKRLKDALRLVGLNNAIAVWNGALRTWDGANSETLPSSIRYEDNNSTDTDNYSVERFIADLNALRVEYREPNATDHEYNYLSNWLYVGTKARQYSISSVFTDAEKARASRNAVPNSGVQAGIA